MLFLVDGHHFLHCLLISPDVEEPLIVKFDDPHDDERNKFSELVDAGPETEGNCLLEKKKNRVEEVEVDTFLCGLLNEILYVVEDGFEVEELLFFFLAFKGPLGSVDLFLPDHSLLLSLVTIPFADVLDRLDGCERTVVYVDVMRYSGKRFVNACDGLSAFLLGLFH